MILMSSGSIGLEGMRAVLRHPKLLGKVSYILESPGTSTEHARCRSAAIRHWEEERAYLEHEILRDHIAMSDDEWANEETRGAWWTEQKAARLSFGSRIGKLVAKLRGGPDDDWSRRREIRKRAERERLRTKLSFAAKLAKRR